MRTERANAKINLYLDVVGRRENGYHDLVSIMQTVSLCDLVTVDFMPSNHTSIHLEASGGGTMPTDCRNLAWRAAERYLGQIQRQGEVRIFLEKHIPMAAGLAGGSADAAAVLRALNRLCGTPLSTEELCVLGATLGADIPFCITGGSALVTGIGDGLCAIDLMPTVPLVVACMGEGVSTPWAYGKLDEIYGDFSLKTAKNDAYLPVLDAMRMGNVEAMCRGFFNSFEEVVPSVQPYVHKLKSVMEEGGAIRAMMSGSGPSVFGVFPDDETATAVCETLRALGAAAFVCYPRAKYSE